MRLALLVQKGHHVPCKMSIFWRLPFAIGTHADSDLLLGGKEEGICAWVAFRQEGKVYWRLRSQTVAEGLLEPVHVSSLSFANVLLLAPLNPLFYWHLAKRLWHGSFRVPLLVILGILLLFTIGRIWRVHERQRQGEFVELTFPLGGQRSFSFQGSDLRLQLKPHFKPPEETLLLRYYVLEARNLKEVLVNGAASPIDLNWPGRRYARLESTTPASSIEVLIRAKNPHQPAFIRLGHMDWFQQTPSPTCTPPAVSFETWYHLDHLSICAALFPALDLRHSMQHVAKRLMTHEAGMQFQLTRALRTRDDQKARFLLQQILRTFPDPMDPRHRHARRIHKRLGDRR